LALALIVGLLLWNRSQVVSSLDLLAHFPPRYLLLALLVVVMSWGIRWAKFQLYLRRLGIFLTPLESFRIFVAGMSMTVTPGKLGEVLKSFLIRERAGVPVSRTASVVVLERVTDVVGLLGILLLASGAERHFGWVEGISSLGVLALLCFFAFPRPTLWLLDYPASPVPEKFRVPIRGALAGGKELASPGLILVTGLLSIPAWALEAMALHLILQGLGTAVALEVSLRAYALGTLAGAVSFLPGGLGAAEGGMLLLLQRGGIPRAASLAATILLRLSTLWFGVLAGSVALALEGRSAKEAVCHAEVEKL
jgi:uncharacterized membrane protein YbhN (UPF0104 family)